MDEAKAEAVYIVCVNCAEAKRDDDGSKPPAIAEYEREHASHSPVHLVPDAIFRSDWLKRGYVDVDRPSLEPIVLKFGGESRPAAENMPFGKPDDKKLTLSKHRAASRSLLVTPVKVSRETQETPPVTPLRIEMRPTWDQTFLEMAFVIAKRGTCARRKVGAILVKDTRIISEGYNGAPSGLRHCDHANGADLIDGHCSISEHAERNALLYAGRESQGSTMYVTIGPCLACARMMVTAGVRRIVFADDYRPDRNVDELCAAAGIVLEVLRIPGQQEQRAQ